MTNDEKRKCLQEKLDYHFTDKEILLEAMTSGKNQKLAILGDAILDYIIIDYFYLKKDTREKINLEREKLLGNKHFVELDEEQGLTEYLIEDNENQKQSNYGKKACGTLYEAIIGAIYRDTNNDLSKNSIVRKFVSDNILN